MKLNKIKTIFSLLLAVVTILGLPATVLADSYVAFGDVFEQVIDQVAKKDIVTVYNPGSVYSETDLFENFKGVMPGDKLNQTVTIKNENKDFDYLKVYLQAVPHDENNKPVVEQFTDIEAMNKFLQQMTLTVKNKNDNDKVIFNASLDQSDGLAEPVYLGQIAKGETIELDLELNVSPEMGNEFMNCIGEVDWKFLIRGYDVDKLTVRKVWTGSKSGRPSSVTVELYQNDKVFDTQQLSASNQWTYTWDDLDQDYTWTVKEVEIDGYTTTYRTEGNVVTITNHKPTPIIPPPQIPGVDVTVDKVWDDNDFSGRPESITVNLYKNGKLYDTEEIDEDDDWTYTWEDLNPYYKWTVEEEEIPGYIASYRKTGRNVTITNRLLPIDEIIVTKEWDDDGIDRPDQVIVCLFREKELVESVILNEKNDWTYVWEKLDASVNWYVREVEVPGYTTSYDIVDGNTVIITNHEIYEDGELTVSKVWEGEGTHPEAVVVTLYKDGEAVDGQLLNDANNWTYTWEELDSESEWTVKEEEVEGYTATYTTDGDHVTITNAPTPVADVELTVRKAWNDTNERNRPDTVTVTLYNGEKAVETITLGDWNGWTYTWTGLDGRGQWQVLETNIPQDYVPSYAADGNIVTITNNECLIQTGQLNWPIPVLSGLGVLLVAFGLVVMKRKQKEENV